MPSYHISAYTAELELTFRLRMKFKKVMLQDPIYHTDFQNRLYVGLYFKTGKFFMETPINWFHNLDKTVSLINAQYLAYRLQGKI